MPPPASAALDRFAAFLEQSLGPFFEGPNVLVDATDTDGTLDGVIVFPDGCQFHVALAINTRSAGDDQWEGYALHCQDAEGHCVIRFDNAPHHPGPTFPHHVHRGDRIYQHARPTGRQIVNEVLKYHNRHRLA